ncbi:MAG: 5'/3'-nucleotidase SurE [Actinobacteria bacterium]|nr:5'/3'-nucleotidase SurE [Actinomycetota bacterium]
MNKKTKKIVLLTNDDGIEANGLKTLYSTFSSDDKYDVRIVAPDRERSAVGHAITVFDPISVKKEYIDGTFCGYSVDGTPADCVKLAINAIIKKKPDILISGINRGANVGENIIYSGTVSAATEGTIYGIPAIAASVDSFRDLDYSFAAAFIKKVADLILGLKKFPKRTLLNVNIPAVEEKEIKGIKITRQSDVKFRDIFIKRVDPRGREYYWMDGQYETCKCDSDTDFAALRSNFISITPIQHDMTDYKKFEYFKKAIIL